MLSPQQLYNALVEVQIGLEKQKIDIPELDVRIEDLKQFLFNNFSGPCCKTDKDCKDAGSCQQESEQ